MRQKTGRTIVKRYAGFVARGFDAEDQQEELRKWGLGKIAVSRYYIGLSAITDGQVMEGKFSAPQIQTLNPPQSENGWA